MSHAPRLSWSLVRRYAALLGLWCALTPSVSGATKGPVVLAPEDTPAAAVAGALRGPLSARLGAEVRLLEEVARGLPGRVEPASPATAAGLIAALDGAARSFYYHQRPEEAARRIDLALGAAEALLPRLVDRDRLWESVRRAQLLLATAALAAGRAEEATRRCRQILSRDLDWEPPARDHSPTVRRRYAELREGLLREAVPVRVTGAAGTRVYVQGLARGLVPLQLRVAGGVVRLQGLQGQVLSPEVERAPVGGVVCAHLTPRCDVAEHLGEVGCEDALRRRAGAEGLWRLRSSGKTLTLAQSGAGVRATALPLRLEPRWLGQLADWLVGARTTPPELAESAPPPRPFYRRWWFWTAVGVAAAGALTTYLVAPRGGAFVEPRVAIVGLRWR